MGDYVGNPPPYAKFQHDTITSNRPPKTPAPIFTVNTPNDVALRKDVPFGGLENFHPIFPKNWNFWANFRRDLENFGSKNSE